MKFVIGSDHGGYELKEELKKHLESKNIKVLDVGTFDKKSVDYPDVTRQVCDIITRDSIQGILICGTGIGVSVSANRHKGIRAALCSDEYSARMARAHNNANVLALGGRTIGVNLALSIVDVFIETEFEGGRHLRRINKIDEEVIIE